MKIKKVIYTVSVRESKGVPVRLCFGGADLSLVILPRVLKSVSSGTAPALLLGGRRSL